MQKSRNGGTRMKNLGDMLVSTGPFSEVVIGNQAIVRAMIESGVRVVTSYPGSPTPEIAEAIKAIQLRGILCISNFQRTKR